MTYENPRVVGPQSLAADGALLFVPLSHIVKVEGSRSKAGGVSMAWRQCCAPVDLDVGRRYEGVGGDSTPFPQGQRLQRF